MKKQYPKRPATTEDVQAVRSVSNVRVVLYNTKVIKAGKTLRVTRYTQRLQSKRLLREAKKYVGTLSPRPFISYPFRQRRPDSIRRSVDKLVDLGRTNTKVYPDKKFKFQTRFVRLSFAPGHIPTSRKQLSRWLNKMCERYQETYHRKLHKIWVTELGEKNGRLHIHAIFPDAPYLRNEKWAELWGHGQVYAETPYDDGVGGYMGKYISKDQGHILSGMRSYSVSKGIEFPITYLDQYYIKNILAEAVANGYTIKELGQSENENRGKVLYELWVPPKSPT